MNQGIVEGAEIGIVEEILYAVFNIGFDSFKAKSTTIINDDLCLESLALAKILLQQYKQPSTENLMALFCFHLARIPAKVVENVFVSFFDQEKSKWNAHFLKLGFHYLKRPKTLNKYYLEALIVSKHMTSSTQDRVYWTAIVELYQLLYQLTASPIVKVNWCYALHQGGETDQALQILANLENELPQDHFYYQLTKASILKTVDVVAADRIMDQTIKTVEQKIRINHLLRDKNR